MSSSRIPPISADPVPFLRIQTQCRVGAGFPASPGNVFRWMGSQDALGRCSHTGMHACRCDTRTSGGAEIDVPWGASARRVLLLVSRARGCGRLHACGCVTIARICARRNEWRWGREEKRRSAGPRGLLKVGLRYPDVDVRTHPSLLNFIDACSPTSTFHFFDTRPISPLRISAPSVPQRARFLFGTSLAKRTFPSFSTTREGGPYRFQGVNAWYLRLPWVARRSGVGIDLLNRRLFYFSSCTITLIILFFLTLLLSTPFSLRLCLEDDTKTRCRSQSPCPFFTSPTPPIHSPAALQYRTPALFDAAAPVPPPPHRCCSSTLPARHAPCPLASPPLTPRSSSTGPSSAAAAAALIYAGASRLATGHETCRRRLYGRMGAYSSTKCRSASWRRRSTVFWIRDGLTAGKAALMTRMATCAHTPDYTLPTSRKTCGPQRHAHFWLPATPPAGHFSLPAPATRRVRLCPMPLRATFRTRPAGPHDGFTCMHMLLLELGLSHRQHGPLPLAPRVSPPGPHSQPVAACRPLRLDPPCTLRRPAFTVASARHRTRARRAVQRPTSPTRRAVPSAAPLLPTAEVLGTQSRATVARCPLPTVLRSCTLLAAPCTLLTSASSKNRALAARRTLQCPPPLHAIRRPPPAAP
ncbi:hypothetical protein GGX14DRAFT_644877 [Mycena pura]|uniref:Uncharacterized protein n=1 Tax=Mycena pura TaxID=153505 RepID=A0AAD6V815_9AGAR|nr:hypothetical protein GGX14DRAFT_644877 [Mycena pura]